MGARSSSSSSPRSARDRRLTEGPILGALFRLAWPIMLSNLIQTLYNVIDTFWLGRLGREALAAPTLAWPLIFLVISFGAGLGVAGTALVAQYTGARRTEEADRAAGQALIFLLVVGALLGLGGYLAAELILGLMGPEPGVLELAAAYMRIIFASLPAMFAFFAFSALLQGWGDTFTPMKLSLISVGVNILLDPLLIFGMGPFPRWEVAGAAAATALSRAGAAIWGLYLLFSGRVGLALRPGHLRPDPGLLGQLARIGLPASLSQSSTALGFSVMMGIVARFGTATIGAFGVGNRVIGLATMPAMGLSRATATMVGQNLGGDRPDRAERAAWASIAVTSSLLLAAGVGAFLLRRELVRAFIADAEVIQRGAELFQVISFSLPFLGMLQAIIGAYQGAGHTLYSMLFSVVRLWVLRLPLAWLLSGAMGMGSDGLWWAMSLSNFGGALLALALFLTGNWKGKVIERLPAFAPAHAHRGARARTAEVDPSPGPDRGAPAP